MPLTLGLTFFAASLALPAGFLGPAEAASTGDDDRFFETRVRPLLVERCFKCHGPDKQKAGLRLDSADAFRKGGTSSLALVDPAKPDDGLLLRAIRHADGVEPMPPGGRLTEREVADLHAWVKRGAAFPAAASRAGPAPPTHWAFQSVRTPPVPMVKDAAWSKCDVDRFVLAKLEATGLTPARPADKRTLLRRATIDLTGLPPTPEEVDAFLADGSPEAFAHVVDRLLASPAYGERWGRHWLDVARYADSNGLDENVAHGNAWRYRDYVVRAFNTDKPYDRFLMEQIAGDLLPATSPEARNEHLVATGFLALGPKVLAEPDEKKMEFDVVDEQVDTLGRTVMGLTVGCARCHDHKFDPMSQEDYYGLAGVFMSTRTMESFTKIARWHENRLAVPAGDARMAAHQAKLAPIKERLKALTIKPDAAAKAELSRLQAELAALEKDAPEPASAMGVAEGKTIDAPLLRRGNHTTPGPAVPRRFPAALAGAKQPPLPKDRSGRLELARWLADPKHPLTARVMVNRVWRWHFGKGIVRSVDNFGLLGQRPTHPELLDWLAATFVADDWSVKRLHSRLMLSATYQMSAARDPKALGADPDNRLLWRMEPRRLEAEALRDALLAAAGLLDRTPGGPALTHVKNREFVFDHTSKDKTNYASPRRSVYLPMIRNNLYDVFRLFDAPDAAVATGDRACTTVPTQALFFMNSDLVARASDGLAARLLGPAPIGDDDRVRLLFALTYCRPPAAAEADRVMRAVAALAADFSGPDAERRRRAWSAACQAIFASDEFVNIP